MKKLNLIVVLISSFLFSCENSEKVEISKEEYNKLKGIKEKQKQVISINDCTYDVIEGSDGHLYYSQVVGKSGYVTGNIWLHYIECEKCKRPSFKQ